jgi:hypothetical protein
MNRMAADVGSETNPIDIKRPSRSRFLEHRKHATCHEEATTMLIVVINIGDCGKEGRPASNCPDHSYSAPRMMIPEIALVTAISGVRECDTPQITWLTKHAKAKQW